MDSSQNYTHYCIIIIAATFRTRGSKITGPRLFRATVFAREIVAAL